MATPEEQIKSWSEKLFSEIERLRADHPSEADFRRVIDPLLDRFCEEIGLDPLAHSEYSLGSGRADAVFNRLVIEYEKPGVLKARPDMATRHAVQQVKDYIDGLAKRDRHKIERLAGVAFDGYFLIFVRYINGKWVEETPAEVSPHSLRRFLTWLAGLSSGIALTSENLTRDFSIEQLRTQNILRGLFSALNSGMADPESFVCKLFGQWRTFFSEAIDYSEAFGGRKLDPLKKWVRRAGLEIHNSGEAERFFFVLHTYFALLVKLLGWLAVSRHLGGKLGGPSFANLATADGEELRKRLEEMETGGIFRAYGVLNLLEGDFFAWYLRAWNEKLEEAVRGIVQRLEEYDPTTLTLVPEETRDLFKKLYHYLLPREIRHNLGEYYTPDWLAQQLLLQIDKYFFLGDPRSNEALMRRKLLTTHFLDPACGSGTFLVLIIARMVELGRVLPVSERDLLESILKNVVGFDLNPLAVLTARVNYLLAIADLLEHRRGEVTIPVYLADSVRTPAQGEDIFSHEAYEFPTAVGSFRVPAVLCAPGLFNRFCDLVEESLREGLEVAAFLQRVERELGPSVKRGWNEQAAALAQEVYEQMLELHRSGMNGLWARLLKNNFAPLTVGHFDYIVGNPPWINWEHLPDGYRESIRDLWLRYRIAGTFKGDRPRLGAVKVDISALMTYTVADTLLKDDGKLGFVITQSLFKTAGAGAGFRRLSIPAGNGGNIPLRMVHVDDMVDLNPFEGASNRTAVMVLEKGKPTRYPVPYTVWRKQRGARFTYESTLEEVLSATRRLNFQAEPVDPNDPTSPWLTARPKALRAVRKILGQSDYEAHAGACTWANAIYWVEPVLKRPDGVWVVHNLTEGAKVKVEEVSEPIEPDLLYPLLRGRDVQRWRAEPSAWIIMTYLEDRDITLEEMQHRFPRTYGYFKQFEAVLKQRTHYRHYFQHSGKPFFAMMRMPGTFAPWKVVWTRIAQIEAAVIGLHQGKPVVPQETITLVECSTKEEAHYIAASVNSAPFQFAAVSYSQEGGKSMGSMHILEHIRIPRYDPSDPVHQRLSELSEAAHEAARAGEEQRLRALEAELDQQAAKLWGLTEEELREIQKSLHELADEPETPPEEE